MNPIFATFRKLPHVTNRVGLNLNFELECAHELLMNLNLIFAKSMNLNLILTLVFSKSMNLNRISFFNVNEFEFEFKN